MAGALSAVALLGEIILSSGFPPGFESLSGLFSAVHVGSLKGVGVYKLQAAVRLPSASGGYVCLSNRLQL